MKKVLTIAGSDSSGGAGVQADIKTMTVNGVYAMSAITALTAQNTMGVFDIFNVTPEFLEAQLDSVFSDIFPDAVKIGMVSSKELILVIVKKLRYYNANNIVVDPVMIATSGSKLMQNEALTVLREELLPTATIVTPNMFEAEVLSGIKINNREDMEKSAKKIGDDFDCNVLLKGGHSMDNADDLLYCNGEYKWFFGKRADNCNTHGTGCTLSSAIASNLAKGFSIEKAVKRAKEYVFGAIIDGLDIGKGAGPLNHLYDMENFR